MRSLPPNEVEYDYFTDLWPNGDAVSVSYSPGNLNLTIDLPEAFLRGSGCGTHGFVEQIAQILVEEPGSLHRKMEPETQLEEDEEPDTKAEYVFVPAEKGTSFTETRGPEGKRSGYRKVIEGDSDWESSVSHSSKWSEPHERRFRELLLMRDGWCPFTHLGATYCIPAHLAPQSREDVYKDLRVRHKFQACCGLLLNPTLHVGYDRYRWSLYHKDGVYRYISFEGKEASYVQHHGQAIEPSFWRGEDPPHPALCNWHFRQAVMKNIRGYSVRMAINAQ
ncbi:hypothetical protein JCM10213_000367 [Rhodosporidiobolus nylandii]